MQFRFSIRDVLWLTAVVALAAQIMKSPVVLPPSVVVIVAVLLLLVVIVGISRNPQIRRLASYRLALVSTEHGNPFWLLLKNLATAIDSNQLQRENAWQRCGQDYLNSTTDQCAEIREQIGTVIDGLTLFETRLADLESS